MVRISQEVLELGFLKREFINEKLLSSPVACRFYL
jgi:hypothetical protein